MGRHSVYYKGFGEPARIWGTWELTTWSGGFKIWPGGGDLSLFETAEAEVEVPDAVPALRNQGSGFGPGSFQPSDLSPRQDQDSAISFQLSAPS